MARQTIFFRKIYTIVVILLVSILLMVLGFVFIQYRINMKNQTNKIITEVMEEQKNLSENLYKDIVIYYYQSLASSQNEDDTELQEVKETILSEQAKLAKAITLLENGYITDDESQINIKKAIAKEEDAMSQILSSWGTYQNSILLILQSDSNDEDRIEALNLIFNSNQNMSVYIETIRITAVEKIQKTTLIQSVLGYAFVVVLCIVVGVTIFYFIRYLAIPFQQLYTGVAEIGLKKQSMEFLSKREERLFPIVEEISEMLEKINILFLLINNMNNNTSFTEMLQFINKTFSNFIPYNYIGVALLDNETNMLKASYGVSDGTIIGLPQNIAGITININDTSLKSIMDSGEPRIINDLEEYVRNKPIKLYNEYILKAGVRASISLPLKVAGEPLGIIFFSSHHKNVYTEEHLNFLEVLANSIAVSFNQNIFIQDLLYSSTLALAKLAEARDEDTGEHLERMQMYTKLIAELLQSKGIYTDIINYEYIEELVRFSPLHDIGKVGIQDSILLKPGKLTEDEFEVMKYHTIYGAEVMKSAENNLQKHGKGMFRLGIEIAENHHEKWDGSGYPLGKKEEEIPLCARIVAIADVFDALTSKRPYKKPFTFEESFSMLLEASGTHFDPMIMKCLDENKHRLYHVYQKYQKKESSD